MKKGYKFTEPMTEDHKKHLSESAKKIWTEERKKKQSDRMKKLWTNNNIIDLIEFAHKLWLPDRFDIDINNEIIKKEK